MSASNYLPPFTADGPGTGPESAAGSGAVSRVPVGGAPMTASDAEVTYADFLGDEVDG